MTMSADCRKAAKRFAEDLRLRLQDGLHSVVLYGSVARGEAHYESDVDLLVVADDPAASFETAGDLAYEIDWESGFRTLLTPVELSPAEVRACLQGGDPFLREILEEGEVLYDDGTISRLRDRFAAARA